MSETRVKGQILDQKVPRYSYHLRTSKGFRVPGSGGRDQYIFFSVISQDIYTHTQTSSLFCFSAAKSLQSCPTLCDPIDSSLPGSPCPRDSPGKNNGVGCHFLLQCMKVKSESEVVQSCLTLHNTMDCSLRGSSVYGIFQARVLDWGAIAFSAPTVYRGSNFSASCQYLSFAFYNSHSNRSEVISH